MQLDEVQSLKYALGRSTPGWPRNTRARLDELAASTPALGSFAATVLGEHPGRARMRLRSPPADGEHLRGRRGRLAGVALPLSAGRARVAAGESQPGRRTARGGCMDQCRGPRAERARRLGRGRRDVLCELDAGTRPVSSPSEKVARRRRWARRAPGRGALQRGMASGAAARRREAVASTGAPGALARRTPASLPTRARRSVNMPHARLAGCWLCC